MFGLIRTLWCCYCRYIYLWENAPAPQIHTCGCRRLPSSGCCVAFSGTNEQCPQLSVLFHWLIGLQRFPYWDLNIQMHNEPWFVISLSPICGRSKTTMCLGLTINDEEFWAFITWYYMHLSENRVPQIDGMSSNCLDLGYCIPPHYILTIVGLDSNNFLVSLVKSKCSVAPMQPQLLGGHYQFHTWCLDRAPGLDRWFLVTLCNTCVLPPKKWTWNSSELMFFLASDYMFYYRDNTFWISFTSSSHEKAICTGIIIFSNVAPMDPRKRLVPAGITIPNRRSLFVAISPYYSPF